MTRKRVYSTLKLFNAPEDEGTSSGWGNFELVQPFDTSGAYFERHSFVDNPQDTQISRPVTAVEFCAGYQGIHLGLRRAIPNLRVVAVSEIEAFAAANLVAKMEEGLLDSAPVWPDLKTFPNKDFYGKVGLLVAGFPCQPFSAAGKRGGDEDPRHLFPYIKQSLIDMQPECVFLENVEGIISAKLKGDGWNDPEGTPVLLHVLRELERVGYRATAGVFSASEVGAPHQRKRVFILAKRKCQRPQGYTGDGDGSCESRRKSEEAARPACQIGVSSWPARPGAQQYDWEPPRVVGKPKSDNQRRSVQPEDNRQGVESRGPSRCGGSEAQPAMGRDLDGLTDRLDLSELYESCDNRTDELRLLGNGVVPACAERAWRVLTERLNHA